MIHSWNDKTRIKFFIGLLRYGLLKNHVYKINLRNLRFAQLIILKILYLFLRKLHMIFCCALRNKHLIYTGHIRICLISTSAGLIYPIFSILTSDTIDNLNI
jgi:hypothetical protein